MSELPYKQLLNDQIRKTEPNSDLNPRKRRRTNRPAQLNGKSEDNVNGHNNEVIVISDSQLNEDASDSWDSEDFEDVDINASIQKSEISDDSDIEPDKEEQIQYNFDEQSNATDDKDNSITIQLQQPIKEESTIPKARKFTPILKEEREKRRLLHQMYLGFMLSHGVIRNRWCNDYGLLTQMRKFISPQLLNLLNQDQDNKLLSTVRSRRFLDGIQSLLQMYSRKFKVTCKGLIRKNWNELSIKQTKIEKDVSFGKFKRLVTHFKGSVDIGAQGFVTLLRSIGLNARLIFSLQPPDYTLVASLPKLENTSDDKVQHASKEQKRSELLQKFRSSNDSRFKLLNKVRSEAASTSSTSKENVHTFENSQYPIFWIEVWNKFSEKWISIDPMVLKVIEQAPMRRKSRFEPPGTDHTNQCIYVIAYDKLGGVKDVTRRYSQYYNARTVKKRIGFRSEEDDYWYSRLLKSCNSSLRKNKINKLDILELKEFHSRDLAEGIPNNVADFKNHPIYALESQLKQNEIIHPKDDSSKCGTFRNKGKNASRKVIPIFKRSHVYSLRSARAWYMRGRVLKMGVQPLKERTKPATNLNQGDENEDETVRLYAEFQTKLYIPPAVIDGKIPKNAYGNIDIYTATMLPEGGTIIPTTGKYTMKMAERAARYILEIDYAKAVVAFDFGKGSIGRKSRGAGRTPTAKEGGILIDKQYAAAIYLVLDCLVEEEEEKMREAVELNSLRTWKFFLTKLRITDRLNREHGNISNEDEDRQQKKSKKGNSLSSSSSDETSEEENFSVHDDTSGESDFEQGGFFVDTKAVEEEGNQWSDQNGEGSEFDYPPVENEANQENQSKYEAGGFAEENYVNDYDWDNLNDHGGGGFIVEDENNDVDNLNSGDGNEIEIKDMSGIPYEKSISEELIYDSDKGTEASEKVEGEEGYLNAKSLLVPSKSPSPVKDDVIEVIPVGQINSISYASSTYEQLQNIDLFEGPTRSENTLNDVKGPRESLVTGHDTSCNNDGTSTKTKEHSTRELTSSKEVESDEDVLNDPDSSADMDEIARVQDEEAALGFIYSDDSE